MKYKSNTIFKANLPGLHPESIIPSDLFGDLLNDAIICIDDCYFFSSLYTGPRDSITDKSRTEVLYNKFLVSDYLEEENMENILFLAIGLANGIAQKIKENLPGNFKIALSFDESFYTIFFYKIRSDDPYLTDNLDDYKNEAVLTIDT